MRPATKKREKGRCLGCGAPFFIRRSFANRNAKIRYCDNCKSTQPHTKYGGKAGRPKRISKFSKSGEGGFVD